MTQSIRASQDIKILLSFEGFSSQYHIELKRESTLGTFLGDSETGNIQRIDNLIDSLEKKIAESTEQLDTLKEQLENAKAQIGLPFPQEEELQAVFARDNADMINNIERRLAAEKSSERSRCRAL